MFAAEKISRPSAATQHREARAVAALQQPLRQLDIKALAAQVGHGYHLQTPEIAPLSPIMQGSFSIARLRPGFFLHCTDVAHLYDMTSQFVMLEESVKVLLKLEGSARVTFGGQPLDLDAGQGSSARPRGAVVALSAPEDFERRCRAGTRERMVAITLTPDWFEAAGLAPPLFRQHLSIKDWQPSARAIAIAEQLVRPASFDGPMHALYQESRALELVAEALAQAGSADQATPPDLRPAEYRRICRLQEFLDSGQADHLAMSAIAQEIGCNTNTLQRQFRQTFGKTIFDYLRETRLQRAADALERDGISVGQAAELAGYNNQANFSTAFRRHFGIAPKWVRSKI